MTHRATDPWRPTAIDREHMGRELFEQLANEGGLWVAVRVEGTGWNIVRPRSQEALLEALSTDPDIKATAPFAGTTFETRAERASLPPAGEDAGEAGK